MTRIRCVLFVCPLVCALAQTPPAPPPQPATQVPVPAQENPDGSITLKLPVPPPMEQVSPETVVITVGDFKLTAAQFDALVELAPEPSKAFLRSAGRYKFAEQIAKVMVLQEEARRRKLDETDSYKVQAAYRTDEWLSMLAEKSIREGVKVDDEAVRAYYEAHKSQYERVRARHILIRTQGSSVPLKAGAKDLSDAEGLAKARQIIQRVKAGEDFGTIAINESDDPGTAPAGGDMGWFVHGQMLPSIEEAAFKLQPGEVGEPFQSEFGYNLVQVTGREAKSLEEMRPWIEKQIVPEMIQRTIDDLEKNAKIGYDPTFFGFPKAEEKK
ncbi:MAG TPA: peptidylprolyl isomerase [Bryobacteraceae bacterium]|nr:peptidylprolyl isomerase [Bryobacteraceae bacterium]